MKRIALMFTAAFLISGLAAHGQKVKPGCVAGIGEIELKAGIDITNDQIEAFYLEEFIPAFNKVFPSIPLTLMKGDRGERKGKYAEFYVFKSLDERSRWWLEDGVASEETQQGIEKLGETWNKYVKMFKGAGLTEYIVLPFPGKSFEVKPGNVVSYNELEMTFEEGMTSDQFEKLFQDEYIPAVIKNFSGTEDCILKGDRGERTGKYVEFWVFESLKERNSWFPEPRKSSEDAKKAFDNMREIQERMMKMCSGLTVTDYIVL